jgi:hypothetical protein
LVLDLLLILSHFLFILSNFLFRFVQLFFHLFEFFYFGFFQGLPFLSKMLFRLLQLLHCILLSKCEQLLKLRVLSLQVINNSLLLTWFSMTPFFIKSNKILCFPQICVGFLYIDVRSLFLKLFGLCIFKLRYCWLIFFG